MKRTLPLVGLALVLAACGGKSSSPLVGSGATFPAPLYNAWIYDYGNETGNKVNYQAVGSGSGVRQYNAGTTDFGASDKSIPDDKIKEPVVQIPMTGGAIVPAYNNPSCPDLRLSQTQLADIFLGKITNWNQVNCLSGPIQVVYRSDGSGTTAGWTNSLSAFSPEWKEKVGTGKSVAWPVGIGAKGNSGVAGQIQNIEGSIGYLNYGFVVNNDKIEQASLQNRDGNYVKAGPETSSAGLSQIVLDDKLRGADPNPAGANSYPIVSLTWILGRPDYDRNDDVKSMLRYMLSPEAQAKSDSLGYVPLPEGLRQQSLAAVETLR